jgi:hypothetical protein
VLLTIVSLANMIWHVCCHFGSSMFRLIMNKTEPSRLLRLLGQQDFTLGQKFVLKYAIIFDNEFEVATMLVDTIFDPFFE